MGSCGSSGNITINPVHPPFQLPGEPGAVIYSYPEGFNLTNSTEAASASSASSSQAAASSTAGASPTSPTYLRTTPTPGVRDVNYPPYVINSVQARPCLCESSSLVWLTISTGRLGGSCGLTQCNPRRWNRRIRRPQPLRFPDSQCDLQRPPSRHSRQTTLHHRPVHLLGRRQMGGPLGRRQHQPLGLHVLLHPPSP